MIKIGLYDLVTSTTLESNKSQIGLYDLVTSTTLESNKSQIGLYDLVTSTTLESNKSLGGIGTKPSAHPDMVNAAVRDIPPRRDAHQ